MLPLANRRILVTRSRQQASALAQRLEALGATAILVPAIEFTAPENFAALDQAIASLPTFDWLLFTSANAVEAFERRLLHADAAIPGTPTAVIGPATRGAAEILGLNVRLTPPVAVAESLAEALLPLLRPGARILMVRAAVARDHLPGVLTAAGAQVTIAEAYRTVLPADSIPLVRRIFTDPAERPHILPFTSSSTVTNLLALLEAAQVTLPPEIVRASIGPITSETLAQVNLPPHVEAREATVPALVQAIADYVSQSPAAP